MRKKLLVIGLVIGLALTAIVYGLFYLMQTPWRSYRSDLVKAISEADKIVVSEHSNKLDFFNSKDGYPKDTPFILYGSKKLSEEHKKKFLREAKRMKIKVSSAFFSACIFNPHHTIKFFKGDSMQSTMKICFKCGQVSWDIWEEGDYEPQKHFMHVLSQTIERVGFQTDRDWMTLAQEYSEQGSGQQPPDSPESKPE